jgi:hypothetical protein
MSPERALVCVGHLLALTARDSGTSEEEARTAAVAACRLIVEHHLLDRDRAVDLALATRLALRVARLERALKEERAARSAEGRGRGVGFERRQP